MWNAGAPFIVVKIGSEKMIALINTTEPSSKISLDMAKKCKLTHLATREKDELKCECNPSKLFIEDYHGTIYYQKIYFENTQYVTS